jgi:hypothetical protein
MGCASWPALAVVIPMMRMIDIDVRDCIDTTRASRERHEDIEGITIHRIGDTLGKDGYEITRAFRNREKYQAGWYTGGRVPYTFLILPDGAIDQMLPLWDVGPHALRWSSKSIGIACLGDFRKHEPTPAQWISACELSAALYLWINGGAWIKGHDELQGGSSDPTKSCPGARWSMQNFRRDTFELVNDMEANLLAVMTPSHLRHAALGTLIAAGVVQ